ncbi:MAG TPA: hypothetical protein VFE53_23970 [Mucilaginibacter sp.]|jgi:hypothetical protein|nr:hypothetical protein [Mucilaginibacter sp.]
MEIIEQEYIVHPTDTPGQFIHEYPGGRRVLVAVDPETGKEHFIREL